jgi:hypothetical protein
VPFSFVPTAATDAAGGSLRQLSSIIQLPFKERWGALPVTWTESSCDAAQGLGSQTNVDEPGLETTSASGGCIDGLASRGLLLSVFHLQRTDSALAPVLARVLEGYHAEWLEVQVSASPNRSEIDLAEPPHNAGQAQPC